VQPRRTEQAWNALMIHDEFSMISIDRRHDFIHDVVRRFSDAVCLSNRSSQGSFP
jgi:hypothetical protein